MAEQYKIETEEELLEKINEEIEILESIYSEDNIVLEKVAQAQVDDADTSTASSDENNQDDINQPISQFKVQCVLDIKPAIGGDDAQVALLLNLRVSFDQFYPFRPPRLQFTNKKGLEEDQYEEILDRFNQEAKRISTEKIESEDDSGFLYDFYEVMREIITEFNDTIKGTCAICMDDLCNKNAEGDKFSDRVDLIRIDQCFHRFHVICLHRQWFMPRHSMKDEFGGIVNFELPEEKSCPVCRRLVEQSEVQYAKTQLNQHPELEDGGYLQVDY